MRYFCFFLFLASAVLAATPPQGKSIKSDQNFEPNDTNLSWWDVPGRIERRSLLIKKEEEKVTPGPKKKSKVSRRFKESVLVSQAGPKTMEIGNLSNLPAYHQGIDRSEMKASERVVFVPQNSAVKLGGIKVGDIVRAVVEQEIKASPSVPTPIRAIVISGPMKGAYFIGEATLDKELKRVLMSFSRLRVTSGGGYFVKATGLSTKGSIGLEGEYHTQAGKFFVAEMASATAAGVLDSTINRSQTPYGGYVQEPSLSNSAKAGAVTALSRTADRMAEGVRAAPEYTETEGFQEIQVIVQEEPTEQG